MKKGIDYNIDEHGKWVFTAKYHQQRGYCCGEACKHCPFDYESVPEPIKTRATLIRNNLSKSMPNAIHTKDN
jgi:Family of unknown function (DUF5522)